MRKNSPFNQSEISEFEKNTLPERSNPLTDINSIANQNKRYKSVRVHKEDFRYLKEYAFYNEIGIIDVVALGVRLLKEKEANNPDSKMKD